ncbi:hypothetical protein LH435_08015 [Laribacter hongkongensis]|nr:hypothetical protein [Laribacter hongkongensis]MCG8995637.1 hypothetical protein [Laribacter hongkongensis]MCG9010249.1 hypothetical protein [Laribacter hongkongensis]MCG9023278.1 hypothetical protein [Laribacter hongkongensis]MCG9047057.1 hypothetical protein [Laribacter hongkongensis]MCG9065503.1 hypothetical protein [Laribacter hongkongensis]
MAPLSRAAAAPVAAPAGMTGLASHGRRQYAWRARPAGSLRLAGRGAP